MYKVVIVDDEEFIIEGLVNYIQWNDYNCQVVGTAVDGKMGLEVISRECPDIVITDIRMPNIDGLTMVANIKQMFPGIQVTVITGFRDFDYAQRAIKLGVTRLVLKPTKMEELIEALEAMTANLAAQEKAREDEETESITDEQQGEQSNSFIVSNAIAYIEKNFASKLTLQEVAEQTYVSQWHLSKLLKKHTNQSFYDVLNKARIGEAKKLLHDPSLKIHDVAERVGFADVTHFSKIFKKLEEQTPNEYRNSIVVKKEDV